MKEVCHWGEVYSFDPFPVLSLPHHPLPPSRVWVKGRWTHFLFLPSYRAGLWICSRLWAKTNLPFSMVSHSNRKGAKISMKKYPPYRHPSFTLASLTPLGAALTPKRSGSAPFSASLPCLYPGREQERLTAVTARPHPILPGFIRRSPERERAQPSNDRVLFHVMCAELPKGWEGSYCCHWKFPPGLLHNQKVRLSYKQKIIGLERKICFYF